MGPALASARTVGALVIEDAAQSMGARVDGRHVGTRGHAGLYSFGPGKPLALGGGGLLVTSDERLAAALHQEWTPLAKPSSMAAGWSWMRMGLFSLAFQPSMWWLATKVGAQKVGANEASWGYQLSGFSARQAAVGLALLPRLDAINQQRRAHARQLLSSLAGLTSLVFPASAAPTKAVSRDATALEQVVTPDIAGISKTENTKQPIYLRLPLLTSTGAQADTIFAALSAAGIGVGRMYGRTISSFFPQLGGQAMPGSERVARTLLTLPTNYHLSDEEIARIPQQIRAALTTA
jgi:dTDP-4-amino-4,6-dideoxygalactose transaminase